MLQIQPTRPAKGWEQEGFTALSNSGVVAGILKDRDRNALWIAPDDRIADLLVKFEFEDVGALVVSIDGSTIEGIISERDVVRGMRYYGAEVLEIATAVLMQDTVITCEKDTPVAEAMLLMRQNQIRHLPVTENGKFSGMLSVRDFLPRSGNTFN